MDPQGPSQGVSDQMIAHLHLVSTFRYATHHRVETSKVTEWLLAAPRIAKNEASFYWTYLDTPPDGSVFLTWQPTHRMGTEFATDGYIWGGPEVVYSHEMGNGMILEMYHQRAGYRPSVETYTAHCRRRFRLIPAKAPNPNAPLPQIDPNLWIVQYSAAEPIDRLPASTIVLDNRMNHLLAARAQLRRAGNVERKDFMLADRANWPQITAPRMYVPPPGAGPPLPQTMAYPTQGPGVPSKRPPRGQLAQQQQQQHQLQLQHQQQQQRYQPQPQQQQFAAGAHSPAIFEPAYDEDEDTARGDIFDHLTPREVSQARYEQNLERMEELLSSPYRIGQIRMPDLGLGLKGELARLTEGIFYMRDPADSLEEQLKKVYVGTLDPGLADEFRKRVADHLESTTAEIKQMEAEQAKIRADVEASRQILRAERELRLTVSDVGPEPWRLEGRLDSDGGSDGVVGGRWPQPQQQMSGAADSMGNGRSIEEIVADVEAALGRKAVEVREVHRVQDGGYLEPVMESPPRSESVAQSPPQLAPVQSAVAAAPPHGAPSSMPRHVPQFVPHINNTVMVGSSDMEMGGTAGAPRDQMQHTATVTTVGFSTPTPLGSFATAPQPHMLSAVSSGPAAPATGAGNVGNMPSPQPLQPVVQQEDVEMGDSTIAAADAKEATPPTAPDQGTGSGDWIMIPKNVSATASPNAVPTAFTAPAPVAVGPGAGEASTGPSAISSEQAKQHQAPTPASVPGPAVAIHSQTGTPGGFSSLGDAAGGDPLGSFGGTPAGLVGADDDDALDLGMDIEDSAFGDAFHGVSSASRDGEGDITGDGSVGGVLIGTPGAEGL